MSAVIGTPRVLLRLEGLMVFAGAMFAYVELGANWLLFAILFFAPDLSMLGYLAGRKAGAAAYNVGHWYGLPLTLIALGVFTEVSYALAVGLIWTAHIGFDRALGFGLKYTDSFHSSHLGRIGKSPALD